MKQPGMLGELNKPHCAPLVYSRQDIAGDKSEPRVILPSVNSQPYRGDWRIDCFVPIVDHPHTQSADCRSRGGPRLRPQPCATHADIPPATRHARTSRSRRDVTLNICCELERRRFSIQPGERVSVTPVFAVRRVVFQHLITTEKRKAAIL